ncbi:MAG: DUF58 domain-containing protein [Aquificaceae bacterium]
MFIGITVFFGIAAVNTANNLLYLVVSSMLSFMLVSGILSLYNLYGISVKVIPPQEVYAGRYESFRVILENGKKVPSLLIYVSSNGSSKAIPIIFKSSDGKLSLYFDQRGLYEKINITLHSNFPVGLFERYYTHTVKINLVVFPKPMETGIDMGINEGEKNGYASSRATQRGYDEVHGIREYRGEPFKLIHWKASAKTGNFYVKDTYTEKRKPIVLSLDMVDGSLEERISKLAYLAIKFIKEGYLVGLRIGNDYIKPSSGEMQKRRILTSLALFK